MFYMLKTIVNYTSVSLNALHRLISKCWRII